LVCIALTFFLFFHVRRGWTAVAFKLAKMLKEAKTCYEKAAAGQESYPPLSSRVCALCLFDIISSALLSVPPGKHLLNLVNCSRPWTAGKHMESAGALAKELGRIDETVVLYKRASELFLQCGKAQPSADVLGRGARYSPTF
jgi:hypothetical protein